VSVWTRLTIDSQPEVSAETTPVVLLAGGVGSRLGSTQPKGCTPLSPIRRASLFQLFAEQVSAIQRLYKPLDLIIWTNRDHYQAVLQLFQQHHWFGIAVERVQFICQPELPYLDPSSGEVARFNGAMLQGPCGNGILWRTLKEQGVLGCWKAQGIDYVRVIPVDNPLAKVFVPQQVDAARRLQLGAVLECVERCPAEQVGVIDHANGRIVEYSQQSDIHADIKGYPWGFTGASLWSLEQIDAIADRLPRLEHVLKSVALGDGSTSTYIKQEYFIFDLLSQLTSVGFVALSRDQEFAPLKEPDGPRGIAAVQRALIGWYQHRAAELGVRDYHRVRECMPELWFTRKGDISLSDEGLLSVDRDI